MTKPLQDEWWEWELSKHVPPKPSPVQVVQALLNEAATLHEFLIEDEKMANGYPPNRIIQICVEIASYAKWIASEFHDKQVESIRNQPDNPEQELNR